MKLPSLHKPTIKVSEDSHKPFFKMIGGVQLAKNWMRERRVS